MAFTLYAEHAHPREVTARSGLGGRIMSATSTAIVGWDSTADVTADLKGIQSILDDQEMALPREGDLLDPATNPNLFCTARTVVIEDTKRAQISYEWQRFNTKLNKVGVTDTNAHDFTIATLQTALTSTTTERAKGSDITVFHDGVTQVASTTVLEPYTTTIVEMLLDQVAIENVRIGWAGKINQENSSGPTPALDVEGRSLCTRVEYRPMTAVTATPLILAHSDKWIVTFEFLTRPIYEHWNPTVYWRDPETGRPPSDLTNSDPDKTLLGRKRVEWYSPRNFDIEPNDEYGII